MYVIIIIIIAYFRGTYNVINYKCISINLVLYFFDHSPANVHEISFKFM